MLYVWEICFQEHYSTMEKGEWDKDYTCDYRVVALDYDSALTEAKSLVLNTSWQDDESGEEIFVDDVRLLSINQGISIDAIATVKAA